MRNKENIVLLIISEIFSHKKFTVPLFITLAIYFLGFSPSQSQLICNNGNCEIQNKNRIGITFKTKKINFYEIESFDYKNDYDWHRAYTKLHKRYATAEKRFQDMQRNNAYVIIAKNKNGKTFDFFENTTISKQNAENTVNRLNNALKTNEQNINISY